MWDASERYLRVRKQGEKGPLSKTEVTKNSVNVIKIIRIFE